MKRQKKDKIEKDKYLLEQIQPQGGITFKNESYILTGSGYQTCLHVYGYPKKLRNHWLATLCNITNTIAVVDYTTIDIQDVKRNLNRSMEEQDLRYQMTEHPSDRYEAKQRYMEMQRLFDEISRMKEIMKLIHIRIYVAGRTRDEMENNAKNIARSLETEGYRVAVMLNEMEEEWNALYLPYEQQQESYFALEGQPMSSKTLAGGNPFHFSFLEDPHGSFMGYTASGGNFIFDMFQADEKRRNYNGVVTGLMGSGKSTLLKKLFKDRAMRGDFVRAFDVSGEFRKLTVEFGGKVISLDGSQGIVNPLEIFRVDENEENNYSIHITKLLTFYKFLKADASTEELHMYQQILDELYASFGLKANVKNRENKITGLPVERYPIFTDLIDYIDKKISEEIHAEYNDVEREIAVYEILLLRKVRDTIYTNIATFGHVLNGHTSIKVTDEQIVVFDVKSLKDMAANIFQAIVFSMMTLCYNDSVVNGTIMKKMYEEGQIKFEDVVRFLIIIDEAPRIINTEYLQALEIIKQFLREGRKYFIGIILAAQSITNFFPSLDEKSIQAMSAIFELAQYKFTFQQDQSVSHIIDSVYGNNLTDVQKEKIPGLDRGECFLSISGMKTYQLNIYASEEELRLFSGGV